MYLKIKCFEAFLPESLYREHLAKAKPIKQGSRCRKLASQGQNSGYESEAALEFACQLYRRVKKDLSQILQQRAIDRAFLDERVAACYRFNQDLGREISDADYKTVMGLEDSNGRIVFGPLGHHYRQADPKRSAIADVPAHLQGTHVTLFGPPDTVKMTINAMNSFHRKLSNEPQIIEEILALDSMRPFWGADDEDSKTPLPLDLQSAGWNLTQAFKNNISLDENGKFYRLASSRLAQPLKRFPGLAIPNIFVFSDEDPLPLHIYDFALHLFHNSKNPEALSFYVPKLENEEEARYMARLFREAESILQESFPQYQSGSIRCMVVLENPRAILRTHEIIDELFPYFVGASLGWHDFLASTARLFKNDGNYRIPVKADPDIVIKYIKASHELLADVVGSRGGIKVGGMYGILPSSSELFSESFQITLRGYFRDVLTQLKRNLTGFWVAHPDFVRIGMALVIAWKKHNTQEPQYLESLIKGLFLEKYQKEIFEFLTAQDISSLDKDHSNYMRSLIVADLRESDFIPNNHPDEIRYNIFQSLQYLTDWLCGNGCVALPTVVQNVPVRVMDDLATAERSRWEVWHELRHQRFDLFDFLQMAFEELRFIRTNGASDPQRAREQKVQVHWDSETARWYPVALYLMVKLMTDEHPPEFASEYLLPFTSDLLRDAESPLQVWKNLDPLRTRLNPKIEKAFYLFETCGEMGYAKDLSGEIEITPEKIFARISQFSVAEIIAAASFHGDIGRSPQSLDRFASKEQERVFASGLGQGSESPSRSVSTDESLRQLLREKGCDYQTKFGFKFLVSAREKSPQELLSILESRLPNSLDVEISNAQKALSQIAAQRFSEIAEQEGDVFPQRAIHRILEKIRHSGALREMAVAVSDGVASGEFLVNSDSSFSSRSKVFEVASLSKSVAGILALFIFDKYGWSAETLFSEIESAPKTRKLLENLPSVDPKCFSQLRLRHLLNHEAFNLHYVKGFNPSQGKVSAFDILKNPSLYGYEDLSFKNVPGNYFSYSGGGYLVLESLLEEIEGRGIDELLKDLFVELKLDGIKPTLEFVKSGEHALGFVHSQKAMAEGLLVFPVLAAGLSSTARSFLKFLQIITEISQNPQHPRHLLVRRALYSEDKGSFEFMGAQMGLGFFVAECGDNRILLHQGANEGFRAIYSFCHEGPDRGKGFVILVAGDNEAVASIAEISGELMQILGVRGFHPQRRYHSEVISKGVADTELSSFSFSSIPQEQKVNRGYKEIFVSAFEPCLPEKIERRDPKVFEFSHLNILQDAKILKVSNQRFARAENLLSPFRPQFDPDLYGRQGKIMDSWESARHNILDAEEMVLELPAPRSACAIFLSSEFHDGNQSPLVQIFTKSQLADEWSQIAPDFEMTGHSFLAVELSAVVERIQFVKIKMAPDGGLSRCMLLEKCPAPSREGADPQSGVEVFSKRAVSQRYPLEIPKPQKPLPIFYEPSVSEINKNKMKAPFVNGASAALGAKIIRATNEHYGPARQIISPFPPVHMFDGLESARSRQSGHYEEVEIQLSEPMVLSAIELDFQFFINNNPREVSIFGWHEDQWMPLFENFFTKPFAGTCCLLRLPKNSIQVSSLLLRTFPDGGVNRIRIFKA